MSLALIQESAKEVRRLAIAGSPLAVGDFRLKKLITPLEQAGAKVPVFGQVAKAIADLVNGKEADSSANLLSLSTLLNAILYTQGETGAAGELREIETYTTANSASTRTTARVLKPLVEALTTTGSGRYEIVKSACERGAFNDLRLIDPAIQALGDNYPELADLVAEKILPTYGPGIIPRLKTTLDIKGKKQDARKLKLIHQLDPAGTLELCKTALDDGSPDVKAAAIACLGQHEECLPLVMEQANSKNKTFRAAALEALAAHDRAEITNLFTDLLKGKVLDILARPLRAIQNKQVVKSLLSEAQRVVDLMLKGDEEQIPRFWELLDCMEHRKDAETQQFLFACFHQCEQLGKLKAPKNQTMTGADVMERLALFVYAFDAQPSFDAILAKRDALPAGSFGIVLRCALRTWPPEKVFAEFSPLLGQKRGKGDVLENVIMASCRRTSAVIETWEADSPEDEAMQKLQWDPRWLDAAIKANKAQLVCCLARPDHKGAINYLLKQVDGKNPWESHLAIQALARCQYPNVTDLFLDLVKKKVKHAQPFQLHYLFDCARFLPPTDLPKLEAFAATLDEKFVDTLLEAIQPLRLTQPSTQPAQ